MPTLPPTMQSVLKTLLVANDPLGRSTIIERADISTASYDRNIDDLAALGIVEATGNGGHRKWQAWLIPWWSSLADVDAPRTDETDEGTVRPPSRWDDVLYEIALELGCDPEYELFAGLVDIDEVFATLPALDRWRGFVEAHYDRSTADASRAGDHDDDRESSYEPPAERQPVEIGACPGG